MSYIINIWEIHDFCASHGRVIPHYSDSQGHFTKFHCADRSHDASDIIICSEGQGVQVGTMFGILSMRGYIIEYNDKNEYLFCTEKEMEALKQESEIEKARIKQKRKEAEESRPENPARPRGVKITKEVMDISYKAYEKCTIYPVKLKCLTFSPVMAATERECEDDCIFPTCPFYSKVNLDWKRHQHSDDYDEFIAEHAKRVF